MPVDDKLPKRGVIMVVLPIKHTNVLPFFKFCDFLYFCNICSLILQIWYID